MSQYSRTARTSAGRAVCGMLFTAAAVLVTACENDQQGVDTPDVDTASAGAGSPGLGAQAECREVLARAHANRQARDSALAARTRQCVDLLDQASLSRTAEMVQPVWNYAAQMLLDIPEYHDEQRLEDGAGGFGPLVKAFALPTLDGYTDVVQFGNHGTRGALVAVVAMDLVDAPDPLPKPYLDLGLVRGVTCVYLAYQQTWAPGNDPLGDPLPVSGWRAYMTEGTANGTKCEPAASPAWRRVHRTVTPRPFGDYPPVARFTENNSGGPLLGVKCVDGWCDIGPRAQTAKPPMAGGTAREHTIKGWHDEQMLSMIDASSKFVPAVRAQITPEPNIHQIPIAAFNTWQQMAVITLKDPPVGKYADWGLAVGDNMIRLRRPASGIWEADLLPENSTQRLPLKFVARHEHVDAAVPGTARFRWTSGDEGVWVPCGQGCCKVEGIAQ